MTLIILKIILALLISLLLALLFGYFNDNLVFKPFIYDYKKRTIILKRDSKTRYEFKNYSNVWSITALVILKNQKWYNRPKKVYIRSGMGTSLIPSLNIGSVVIYDKSDDFINFGQAIDFDDIKSFRPYEMSWFQFLDRNCCNKLIV